MAGDVAGLGVVYRDLAKDEKVLAGDEVLFPEGWERSGNYRFPTNGKQDPYLRYRRAVTVAAPVEVVPHAVMDSCVRSTSTTPIYDRWLGQFAGEKTASDAGLDWRIRPEGQVIQSGDEVRTMRNGRICFGWSSGVPFAGTVTSQMRQARYRVATPAPEMTTAIWHRMGVAEQREYNRPAVMAWLDGQTIQQMGFSGCWHDHGDLHTNSPLRVKYMAPKLVWSSDVDDNGNTLWRSLDKCWWSANSHYYTVRQVLIRDCVRHVASAAKDDSFGTAEDAKAACQAHYEKR